MYRASGPEVSLRLAASRRRTDRAGSERLFGRCSDAWRFAFCPLRTRGRREAVARWRAITGRAYADRCCRPAASRGRFGSGRRVAAIPPRDHRRARVAARRWDHRREDRTGRRPDLQVRFERYRPLARRAFAVRNWIAHESLYRHAFGDDGSRRQCEARRSRREVFAENGARAGARPQADHPPVACDASLRLTGAARQSYPQPRRFRTV